MTERVPEQEGWGRVGSSTERGKWRHWQGSGCAPGLPSSIRGLCSPHRGRLYLLSPRQSEQHPKFEIKSLVTEIPFPSCHFHKNCSVVSCDQWRLCVWPLVVHARLYLSIFLASCPSSNPWLSFHNSLFIDCGLCFLSWFTVSQITHYQCSIHLLPKSVTHLVLFLYTYVLGGR